MKSIIFLLSVLLAGLASSSDPSKLVNVSITNYKLGRSIAVLWNYDPLMVETDTFWKTTFTFQEQEDGTYCIYGNNKYLALSDEDDVSPGWLQTEFGCDDSGRWNLEHHRGNIYRLQHINGSYLTSLDAPHLGQVDYPDPYCLWTLKAEKRGVSSFVENSRWRREFFDAEGNQTRLDQVGHVDDLDPEEFIDIGD
mmetsp:Transcript_48925/g.56234  ORF Transcript_48925/g.56234 Transcript_48925/m.56234 type:complete len:195 (+) Transcript_48925:170-754(+)